MTDEKYGHEGPLVETRMTIRGEEREYIGCARCECYVYASEPEELREMDCDEYAELQDEL